MHARDGRDPVMRDLDPRDLGGLSDLELAVGVVGAVRAVLEAVLGPLAGGVAWWRGGAPGTGGGAEGPGGGLPDILKGR